MKVLHLNYSDNVGGAARAAARIHEALLSIGIDSSLHVARSSLKKPAVVGPVGRFAKGVPILRNALGSLPVRLLKTKNPIIHSLALLPSLRPRLINASDVDVVHLHWVAGEMLSIEDIGKIKKPIVWTLHDMWPICGAEHYTAEFRWRDGYMADNRPKYEAGPDLNRWVWNRKRKAWKPMNMVSPSNWLGECVRQSILMKGWPVAVIPNPLDTDIWRPIDKVTARQILRFPMNKRLLAFGAMGGDESRKGIDLLLSALAMLKNRMDNLELVVFGESRPRRVPDAGFPIHYPGQMLSDISLRLLYSAVDAVAIPSRQDNLPNVGVESLACATPIIGFESCGLPDLVSHRKTGWLARPFQADEFASGIYWLLADDERLAKLSINARREAEERFSYSKVAKAYEVLYESAIVGRE